MPDPRRTRHDPEVPEASEPEDLYDPEYLREVAGPDARRERLEELKRRIALGAYHPDPTSIAEGMLSRAGEPDPEPED